MIPQIQSAYHMRSISCLQRISYTRREVDVLGSQFIELEKLKGCHVVINMGKNIEELTLSVRELRRKKSVM